MAEVTQDTAQGETVFALNKDCENNTPKVVLSKIKEILPADFFDHDSDEVLLSIFEKCSYVSVDYPYFDADYLSTYYAFHVKQFRQHRKECCRLIVYKRMLVASKGSYEDRCMGYITLRPLQEASKIGKTYLNPKVFLDDKAYVIAGRYKIHKDGMEETVRAVPYMKQDRVAVCAHICLWAAGRFYASRFSHYQDYRMGQIMELASNVSYERRIPLSGLTANQVAEILLSMGFSSMVLKNNTEAIIGYLQGGIPTICISNHFEHSVLACGLEYQDVPTAVDKQQYLLERSPFEDIKQEGTTGVQPRLIMSSKLVSNIIVQDDLREPYSKLSNTRGDVMSPTEREDKTAFSSCANINFGIVPLYSKLYMSYDVAKSVALLTFYRGKGVKKQDKGIEKCAFSWQNIESNETYVMRLLVASSNSLKEHIYEQYKKNNIPAELMIHLSGIEYPRLLWIAEISTVPEYRSSRASGLIIMDSSCVSESDPNAVIAVLDQNGCQYRCLDYYDNKGNSPISKKKSISYPGKFVSMGLFNKNLIQGGAM